MIGSNETVVLKLSGERFGGEEGKGFCGKALDAITKELAGIQNSSHFHKLRMVIVVGGGNHFRGAQSSRKIGINQNIGDDIGMLGTAMNVLALHGNLKREKIRSRAMSAVPMRMMETYTDAQATSYLEKGEIVICAGGTGHAFCTTDSAAALRAAELGATTLIKFTSVDGVFSADPKKHPDAVWIPHISYDEVIKKGLGIMDMSALCLCRDQGIRTVVCKMNMPGCLSGLIHDPKTVKHSVISATL